MIDIGATGRPLTPAQRGRLQGIAAEHDNDAKVTGWSDDHDGPIVRYPDSSLAVITPRGRKQKLHRLGHGSAERST